MLVRASGTEPLIKFYILYNGITQKIAEQNCKIIEDLIYKIFNKIN